jgi:hypothetical protein
MITLPEGLDGALDCSAFHLEFPEGLFWEGKPRIIRGTDRTVNSQLNGEGPGALGWESARGLDGAQDFGLAVGHSGSIDVDPIESLTAGVGTVLCDELKGKLLADRTVWSSILASDGGWSTDSKIAVQIWDRPRSWPGWEFSRDSERLGSRNPGGLGDGYSFGSEELHTRFEELVCTASRGQHGVVTCEGPESFGERFSSKGSNRKEGNGDRSSKESLGFLAGDWLLGSDLDFELPLNGGDSGKLPLAESRVSCAVLQGDLGGESIFKTEELGLEGAE